jgi:serine/threonine-protein kinase
VGGAGRARPRLSAGTPFRVAVGSAGDVRTRGDLEEQLRRRLRVYWVLWGTVLTALGCTSLAADWGRFAADPVRLFTRPPLPGALFAMAALSLGIVTALAPHRRLGLRRLRAVEWLAIAAAATLFVANQSRDLFDNAADVTRKPMTFGTALGAAWGYVIVGFGVLIPSSWRHAVARTGALSLCAFVPELLFAAAADGPTGRLATFLALKVIMVGAMGALAIYGAYRIDVLRRDVQAARQLGQYVLTRRISEGGMGEVYLAEHQFLRRPCAVKLIRADQACDPGALLRFEREVQATAALTHPNAVQIYDYGHGDDGTFYYAMEYLPGVSLDELVERHGPLPPARAVHVLGQLCGALREAHGRGLVHRDIKPSNVMLCERGGVHDVAKLLDFGLVATVRSDCADPRLTQAGVVLGTPAFMSPEQCVGDEEVGPASDIYSTGALAYFLLTGEAPFGRRSAPHVLAAHLYEEPRPVSDVRADVPAALDAVVARCLAKEPARRFADVASVATALAHAVAPARWTERDACEWWRRHGTPSGSPAAGGPAEPVAALAPGAAGR